MVSTSKAHHELASMLHPGESIAAWVPATWTVRREASGTVSGVLAVTNQRVIFHGGFLWQKKDHSMPLDTITSFDLERGLVGHVSVLAPAGSIRYLVNRAAGQRWVAAANQQLQLARRPPVGHLVKTTGRSTADEIAKLAELRDAGALTDAEFTDAKIRLLRS